MRGLIILGVLMIALAWAGVELRKTRRDIANALFGLCFVLLVMLIAVLIYGVPQ